MHTIFHNTQTDKIYLLLDGLLREIPNLTTFNQLYFGSPYNPPMMRFENDTILNFQFSDYPISTQARLVKKRNEAPVYLVDEKNGNITLRHITDIDSFNAYHFNFNMVHELPASDPVFGHPIGDQITFSSYPDWVNWLVQKEDTAEGKIETISKKTHDFQIGTNKDIYYIEKQLSEDNKITVFGLQSSNNYQGTNDDFDWNCETPLVQYQADSWQFIIAPDESDDLFGIKKRNTGTNSVEVHIFSEESGYETPLLQIGTPLPEVDDSWHFLINTNRDLYCIKTQLTGSNSTEIHVLSKASNYQTFTLHTGSALPEVGAAWTFALTPTNQLMCIQRWGTNSGKTEVSLINKSHNGFDYQNIPTALHETACNSTFLLANDLTLIQVLENSTASKTTEVHYLPPPYNNFGLQVPTFLWQCDTLHLPLKTGEIILYEGSHYTGKAWKLSNEFKNLLNITAIPKVFGSIQLGPGTCVTTFEGADFSAKQNSIIQSNSKLDKSFSSIKIWENVGDKTAHIGSSVLLTEDFRYNANKTLEKFDAYQTILSFDHSVKSVQVWALDEITIHANDQDFVIDNVKSATLSLNAMHQVVIATEAKELGTPALKIQTDQMSGDDYALVYPDQQMHDKISKQPEGFLHDNREKLGINPSVSQESCGHVEKAIRNLSKAAKYPGRPKTLSTAMQTFQMDDDHWNLSLKGGNPTYSKVSTNDAKGILERSDLHNASYTPLSFFSSIGHAFHEAESFTVSTVSKAGSAIVHEAEEGISAVEQAARDAAEKVKSLADAADQELKSMESNIINIGHTMESGLVHLGNDIENGVINLGKDIKDFSEKAIAITVHFADKAVSFVVDHVEQIGKVIGMVLKKIGAELKKIVDFLKSLFDFKEIMRLSNAVVEMINTSFSYAKREISSMKQKVDSTIIKVESEIDDAVKDALAYFGVQPTSNSGGNTLEQEVMHKVTWFLSKITGSNHHWNNTSISSSIDKTEAFLIKMAGKVGTDILDELLVVLQDLSKGFTNPSKFPGAVLQAFGDFVSRFIHDSIDVMKDIVDFIFEMFESLIDDIVNFLNKPIEIPFISDLISLFTDVKIRYIDIFGLVIAIPMEISEKISGDKYFETVPTLSEKDNKVAFALANEITTYAGSAVSIVNSLESLGMIPVGVGVLYQIFRWPGGYIKTIEPRTDNEDWLMYCWSFQWFSLGFNALLTYTENKEVKPPLIGLFEAVRLGLFIKAVASSDKTHDSYKKEHPDSKSNYPEPKSKRACDILVPLPGLFGVGTKYANQAKQPELTAVFAGLQGAACFAYLISFGVFLGDMLTVKM